jgi:phosphoserine phosphatase
MTRRDLRHAMCVLLLLAGMPSCAPQASRSIAGREPLPSWNAGSAKRAISDFVYAATTPDSPGFVPAEERIAVFDNDGTLWCEHPMYPQFRFAMERVQSTAAQHPQWQTQQPFKAAIDGDADAVVASGVPGLIQLTTVPNAGITSTEFERIARDWLGSARHPRFQRPYTDLVYQPMLELLAYLRSAGFKTYIVTGGSAEFVRAWSERAYGVPPEQVIGSLTKTVFKLEGDHAVLVRQPEIDILNDHEGKAVNIGKFIGRRPVLAFGNSDGDLPMLQYAAGREAGSARARLIGYVHHTNADREYAYDRQTKTGRLDKGLEEAARRGWVVVDMRRDWRKVFRFEN